MGNSLVRIYRTIFKQAQRDTRPEPSARRRMMCRTNTAQVSCAPSHISDVLRIRLLHYGKYIEENGISTYHEYKYLPEVLGFRQLTHAVRLISMRADLSSAPLRRRTILYWILERYVGGAY